MRVVIAEDSVLLREGLTRLLTDRGHEVVAGVGDAEALMKTIADLAGTGALPDVVVADVRMPPTPTDEGVGAAGGAGGGGVLKDDVEEACVQALAVPRHEGRAQALSCSWSESTAQFLAHLVPAGGRALHADTPSEASVTRLS